MSNSSLSDAIDIFRAWIDDGDMVEISRETEEKLGVTHEQMNRLLKMLQEEDYEIYGSYKPRRRIACRPGYGVDRAHDYLKGTYIH